MRLIHIHLGDKGGAERFFVHLVKGLADHGVDQRVIIRKNRVWREDIAGIAGIDEFDFSRSHLMRVIINGKIGRIVERFRPNAIVAWMGPASRWVPKTPPESVLTASRLGDYPETLVHYEHSRKLICNTPDIARRCIELGHPAEHTHMISNFTDIRRATPVDRKMLNTPDDAYVVVALGRFVHRKGFDTLTEAIAGIESAYLWLLGDGEDRDALVGLAKRLGVIERLRMPGWVSEPGPFIAASDVFCCPSRHEPLGNVVLEGWAQEKPVIAAASEGPSWLIRHGESGILTAIGNASEISAAIERLRADRSLAAKIAIGGLAKLEADFSRSKICQEYIDVLFG